MSTRAIILLVLSLFVLAGCVQMKETTSGKGDSSPQKMKAEADSSKGEAKANDEGEGSGKNALFDQEDDKSRERRMKARNSLGLGGK